MFHPMNTNSPDPGPPGLTQHVDDSFIVGRKKANGVFEQQHEGCVDHAVGQLVGVGLRKGGKCEVKQLQIRTTAALFLLFYLEIQQRI